MPEASRLGSCAESGTRPIRPAGFPRRPDQPWESRFVAMATHLEIDMPDRRACFQLEDELKRFYPLAVGRHGHWHVELEDDGDHVDAVIATTRRYLREHELGAVSLHVDGDELEIGPG
jgi:hypothetical protein